MVAQHIKLTHYGVFGADKAQPQEIWQFSTHWSDVIGATITPDAMNACMKAWSDYIAGFTLASAALTGCKASTIGTNGKLTKPPVYSTDPAVSGNGNVGQSQTPYQTALCVSLKSDIWRGPLSRGRFYLPTPSLRPDGNDRIDVTAALPLVKDFLTHCQQSLRFGVSAQSVELINVSKLSPDYATVQQIKIGNVLDTQRRRRNKIKETYSSVAF